MIPVDVILFNHLFYDVPMQLHVCVDVNINHM